MTSRMILMGAVGAALIATSACSPRRPENLPPAPGNDSAGTGIGADQGAQSGVAVPGSRADFMQQVPSDRVFFALDSYTLTDEARAVLDSQAQWLVANPNVNVTIEGHCDERGTREYNLALGERRANAVRIYLESRGVTSNRMQTISWGKERPEVFGSDEASYAQNRRAVTVVPE